MDELDQPLTFIVRLVRDDRGALSGVVERVRSGEKQRFHGAVALAEVIAAMAARESGAPRGKEPRR